MITGILVRSKFMSDTLICAYCHLHHTVKHVKQGNQRWQTSPAVPPGGLGHSPTFWHQSRISTTIRSRDMAFDLKFWKYLSVTVYPYVICMPSFIMIGWEMAEILHFEILRKHGQTNTQTHKQTDMGITIPRPPPSGTFWVSSDHRFHYISICNTAKPLKRGHLISPVIMSPLRRYPEMTISPDMIRGAPEERLYCMLKIFWA